MTNSAPILHPRHIVFTPEVKQSPAASDPHYYSNDYYPGNAQYTGDTAQQHPKYGHDADSRHTPLEYLIAHRFNLCEIY